MLTIFEESLATGYVFLSEVLVLLPEDVHIFILKFRCLRTHADRAKLLLVGLVVVEVGGAFIASGGGGLFHHAFQLLHRV